MHKSGIGGSGRGSIFVIFLVLMCVIWPALSAERIVNNPRTPKARNAGRVVTLTEVMAIPGEGQRDYNFKYPWNFGIAPDGSLLIRDVAERNTQFLLFDKDGRFLRNLFEKGKEPGGKVSPSGFFLASRNVVVLAEGAAEVYQAKLLWFDGAGTYEREITLPYKNCTGCLRPLAFFDGVFYFLSPDSSWSNRDDKPGFVDVPQNILSFAEGSGDYKSLASFPTRNYSFGSECNYYGTCRGEAVSISIFMAVPYQAKYLVLSHTRDYLLKIYDPVANAVIREFRRDYKRAKNEQGKDETTIGGERRTAPHQKYTPDIVNILTRLDEIWVVTSTRDKAKGALIDIFDGGGVFRDSFYLKLPEPALDALIGPGHSALDGNALYLSTRNPDGTCAVRKYRIDNQVEK